jgi:hypothetical protein
MTDDDPDRFELDGDDFTADDVLDMFHRYARRPRERPRKPPTLQDSVDFHNMAHQHHDTASHDTTGDGVTTETGSIYVGRPVFGELQQEEPDDD